MITFLPRSACLFAVALLFGCSDELSDVQCTSNDDCFGTEACVRGQCRADLAGDDTGDDTSGGGGGTPDCSAYCAVMSDACTGEFAQYIDQSECIRACATGGWTAGSFDDTRGNTIGCRIYHANAAFEEGANIHCPHAGYTGGNICGTWCEVYCDMSLAICVDDNAAFSDFEDCLASCEAIAVDGTIGDVDGDTIQCRMYHMTVAAISDSSADIHCGHSFPAPTDDHCAGPPPSDE